ncbi:hypothetical protein ONE63_002025 [Megalurothrips usitatus]|uniref:Uncharacterized protein n=1 Tax=Megalurothrips usitatus TaxID=439358 RepID=A0AAV7XCG0_9NEOP|nr:hypothetical protein ONE63_002025 [Megalurothrips usitatus]
MKFLAITLLAVCLIQGHNAQFSGLRNLVSGATSAVNTAHNAASGVASAAHNAAQTAANNINVAANNARSTLSSAAQGVLNAAPTLSTEELTSTLSGLSANQLIDTVKGAAEEVKTRAEATTAAITDTVSNIEKQAETAVLSATAGWNVDVKAIVAKAKELGVDVKECAVDKVAELGSTAVTGAVKCVTDKVTEAVTLATNIGKLVPRSVNLATDGISGYRTCAKQTNTLVKRGCQATKLVPVAVKSAILVKDAVQYATQATTLVSTIQTALPACVGTVTAKKAVEAAALSLKIGNCVKAKIQAAKSS